jgi:hypothetical protein
MHPSIIIILATYWFTSVYFFFWQKNLHSWKKNLEKKVGKIFYFQFDFKLNLLNFIFKSQLFDLAELEKHHW